MSIWQRKILAIDDPMFNDARLKHDRHYHEKRYEIEDAEIFNVDETPSSVNTETVGETPALDEEKIEQMKLDIDILAAKQQALDFTSDGAQVLKTDVEYIEDVYSKDESVPVSDVTLLMRAQNVSEGSTMVSDESSEEMPEEIKKLDMSKILKYGALAWIAKLILFK